jgi:hypothetical protein
MKVLSWDVGLRTLSYCVLEKTAESAWSIRLWDAIDVQLDDNDKATAVGTGTKTTAKRKKVSTVSVEYAAQLVMDTLHRRAALFDDVDAIIVEQQPAGGHNRHSNVRMKVVSHVIQCYFYTRALATERQPPVITFVSPASKLVDMERAPRVKKSEAGDDAKEAPPPPPSLPQPRQYALNKKFAITKTQELLGTVFTEEEDNAAFATFFNSATVGKKDDLADSFLLNYYYILKHTAPKKTRAKKEKAVATKSGNGETAPEVKKRGRKKKESEQGSDAPPEPPKKRGRKPKAVSAKTAAVTAE